MQHAHVYMIRSALHPFYRLLLRAVTPRACIESLCLALLSMCKCTQFPACSRTIDLRPPPNCLSVACGRALFLCRTVPGRTWEEMAELKDFTRALQREWPNLLLLECRHDDRLSLAQVFLH
jgi:hypothetical protein